MQGKAELYRKVLYIFILSAPFVDMLTSVGVRLGLSGMTMGMLARFTFLAAMVLYVLFVYRGKQMWLLRWTVIATILYGVAYLGCTVRVNGMGVLVENAKMFLKVYSFIYVLLGFYALYLEHGILVSDKLLTTVFCVYSASIFLSAVTNTSFYTYVHQQVGYCGWFYAGNEIGAIVAILAGIAMFYGFTYPKYWWACILGLLAFSSTYIGTKVPFLAIAMITVLLLGFGLLKLLLKKNKHGPFKVTKLAALLLCIVVLYQVNSPIQQNTDIAEDWYQNTVENVLPEDTEADTSDRLFLVVNWLLSYRLTASEDTFSRYAGGNWAEKLFGIGYTFQIDGQWRSDVVEMDFISIFLKHGIVGFSVFMAPLVYMLTLCVINLFKRLRNFLNLEPAFVYLYAVLIGLACAFLAGHVLVAPAVSVYIAICIVKCYAFLTEKNSLPVLEKGV